MFQNNDIMERIYLRRTYGLWKSIFREVYFYEDTRQDALIGSYNAWMSNSRQVSYNKDFFPIKRVLLLTLHQHFKCRELPCEI